MTTSPDVLRQALDDDQIIALWPSLGSPAPGLRAMLLHFARAVLALSAAPGECLQRQQEQAWQPIETAPKEVLWSSIGHNYSARILAYDPVHREWVRCRWWQSDSGFSNFIADGGAAVYPSHWMPLPPPAYLSVDAKRSRRAELPAQGALVSSASTVNAEGTLASSEPNGQDPFLQLPPGEHLESETQQAVQSKENKQ